LAGTGPLLLVLASNLIAAGADIAGIVEATSLKDLAANAFPLLAGGQVLKTGFDYFKNIKKHGIPMYYGHIITAAHGTEGVEKAVITKVDKAWHPMPGTEKEIPVDAIAFGYNLVPSVEATRLCGCNHLFDERLGYWRVEHDEAMETSVPGIFAAGDGVSVKGYAAAIEEGRVAGIAACARLGRLAEGDAVKAMAPSQKKLQKLRKFAGSVSALSAPRRGILDILSPDTLICRCEEVTLADIRDAVEDGATDVNHLKRITRIGMGYCQGRFCGTLINEILWLLKGSPKEREVFTTRVPLRPISLAALL
jgi:hydrogen cyanide synthase HcnB